MEDDFDSLFSDGGGDTEADYMSAGDIGLSVGDSYSGMEATPLPTLTSASPGSGSGTGSNSFAANAPGIAQDITAGGSLLAGVGTLVKDSNGNTAGNTTSVVGPGGAYPSSSNGASATSPLAGVSSTLNGVFSKITPYLPIILLAVGAVFLFKLVKKI